MLDVQGLDNIENTCFINSVVQCLVALPELRAFFGVPAAREGQDTPTGPVSWLEGIPSAGTPCGPVSEAFGSLVQQLFTSGGKSVFPFR